MCLFIYRDLAVATIQGLTAAFPARTHDSATKPYHDKVGRDQSSLSSQSYRTSFSKSSSRHWWSRRLGKEVSM